MTPALIVALSTVREHSRRKLIAVFVILSLLITAGLIFFASDSDFEEFFDPAFGGMQAVAGFLGTFALIAAIATSMGNVGRPFNSGEALLVLARPVSRTQYVIGRFAAGLLVTWALCFLLAVQTQIVQAVAGQTAGRLWGHWGVTAFNLSIVSAVTNLLSVFVSTPIVAAIFAYLANQVFGVSEFLHRLTEDGFFEGTFSAVATAFWIITPKFLTSPLAARGAVMIDERAVEIPSLNTLGITVWALGWFAGLLALALYFASRKDV